MQRLKNLLAQNGHARRERRGGRENGRRIGVRFTTFTTSILTRDRSRFHESAKNFEVLSFFPLQPPLYLFPSPPLTYIYTYIRLMTAEQTPHVHRPTTPLTSFACFDVPRISTCLPGGTTHPPPTIQQTARNNYDMNSTTQQYGRSFQDRKTMPAQRRLRFRNQ